MPMHGLVKKQHVQDLEIMGSLNRLLHARLEELEQQGLRRKLRTLHSAQGTSVLCGDRPLLNFSSNDYLGLASHPAIIAALSEGAAQYGAGSGASRLICGNLKPFEELESNLAAFKGTEAALVFSTGYAAAIGTICALASKDDILILDRLCHACMIDAARLSKAKLRIFEHNNMNELEEQLRWADSERSKASDPKPNVLVLTESVFSMDGDLAPLRDLVSLKDRYGAWLMIDEAHATGCFGERRSGLAEAMHVGHTIDVQMGTLGKALGVSGGYIAGSRTLIDWLINRARSFVFSTAPPPSVACAASASLKIVRSAEGEDLRQRLWANVNRIKEAIIDAGWQLGPAMSPILPLIVGDEEQAMAIGRGLADRGLLAPAIRPPTVPKGGSRIRLTASATHSLPAIEALGTALEELRQSPAPPR